MTIQLETNKSDLVLKIPTEIPKPPNRVFGLSTPRHMFMKLNWEIKNLKGQLALQDNENELSGHLKASYSAFNVAVMAWHLTDWMWESLSQEHKIEMAKLLELNTIALKPFQDALANTTRGLRICREIANGSKHKVDRGTLRVSLEWETIYAKAGQMRAGDTLASYKYQLVVNDNGLKCEAVDIFDDVTIFWQKKLATWGFLDEALLVGSERQLEIKK